MFTRTPTALAHIDLVRPLAEAGNPVVCNRFPAPVVEPWAESADETFSLVDQGTVLVQTGLGIQTVTWYGGRFVDYTAATAAEIVREWNDQCWIAPATLSFDGRRVRIAGSTSLTLSGTGLAALQLTQHARLVQEGTKDEPICFRLYDLGTSGFDRVQVWVHTNGADVAVFDSLTGTEAAGWSVARTLSKSPGASGFDTWDFVLNHTTDFVSEETVTLTVEASVLDGGSTTATSSFTIEDYERPTISSVSSWTPRALRVAFSEAMDQDAATDPDSVLYTREVQTGDVTYHTSYIIGATTYYNVIEAACGEFVASEEGMFLGSIGANLARNNGAFEILERLSSTLVRVDATLEAELPVDPTEQEPPRLYISAYRAVPVVPAAPTLQPLTSSPVISAVKVDTETLVPGDDIRKYVQLELDDDLTPSATYTLEVAGVKDLAGNLISGTKTFASWQPASVPRRNFDLWNMVPQINKDDDATRDLERTILVLDEPTKVLLNDVDKFGSLLDPTATKPDVLDVILQSFGCNFSFLPQLSTQKKRDLIPLLVPMYKRKGTSKGIEDAVLFFLGKEVVVTPWYVPDDTWELGESELGFNTYLGPSKSFVRYSFYLDHTDTLSTSEKTLITELVHFMRPAHTHFKGFRQIGLGATTVTVGEFGIYLTESYDRYVITNRLINDVVSLIDFVGLDHNRVVLDDPMGFGASDVVWTRDRVESPSDTLSLTVDLQTELDMVLRLPVDLESTAYEVGASLDLLSRPSTDTETVTYTCVTVTDSARPLDVDLLTLVDDAATEKT